MRIQHRIAACLSLLTLAVLASASGCAPVSVRGKVLVGELSMIAVVDKNDPRLKAPGIGEVEITLYQTGRSGDTITRRSNDSGSFSVPLQGTGALSRPVTIEASLAGYSPASETMPTPVSNQRLLILMEPLGGSAP